MGEEDQELEEHLQRRRLNARRMTRLASSTRLPPTSAGFTRGGGRRNTSKSFSFSLSGKFAFLIAWWGKHTVD